MVHIKNNWQYYEEDFVSIWDEVLFWFARHGRALMGASPEHARVVGNV